MGGFQQNVQLDVGKLLQQSWDVFQRDIVTWILIALVGGLALGVGGWGGFHYCVLKALRGEKVEVGDVLYPFSRLSLLVPVLVVFGVAIVTCGLGALVLAFLWMWLYPLMVDQNMDFGPAARLSKEATMANVGPTILTIIVLTVLNSIGSMVFIGTLLTLPFGMIFSMLVYQQMFGTAMTPQQRDYAAGALAQGGQAQASWGAPAGPPPSAASWGAPPAGPPMAPPGPAPGPGQDPNA